MFAPQKLMIQKREQMDDGIGGLTESWTDYRTTSGYLDLVQGTDLNASQQAFLQESTHVAVIPFYQDGITDKMRLIDEAGRWYEITYVDDPVGVHHHLELYLKFGGENHG